jgi:hypothetical protein
MKPILGGLAAVALLLGCTDRSPVVTAPVGTLEQTDASQLPGYVLTPAGWFHSSCVHEIPSGARVSIDHVVTLRDGSTYQIPKCLYAAQLRFPHIRKGLAPPADTGWLEYTSTFAPSGDSYRNLSASWKVPTRPVHSYSSPEVYYTFPGIQNDAFILQPVLQYGFSPAGGGNSWGLASWHCDGPSGQCDHSSLIAASPSDSIYGTVAASACAGGRCTWTVTSVDVTKGTRTILALADYDNYTWATGGAVETHSGFTSCGYFPSAGVFYKGISLSGRNGIITPTWQNIVPINPSPDCGFNVTSTASTASLIHNPPPPSLTSLATNPSPARVYQPFSLTINGSGFDPATVQVVYSLEGCWPPGSCQQVIANSGLSVKTQTQLVVPILTFSVAGTYDFQARNGPNGALSNILPLTVLPLH